MCRFGEIGEIIEDRANISLSENIDLATVIEDRANISKKKLKTVKTAKTPAAIFCDYCRSFGTLIDCRAGICIFFLLMANFFEKYLLLFFYNLLFDLFLAHMTHALVGALFQQETYATTLTTLLPSWKSWVCFMSPFLVIPLLCIWPK